MKEFMMIFMGAGYEKKGLSPDQMEERMGKWIAWMTDLKDQDLYVEGRPLLPNSKRVSGSDQTITDGPYVETNELIGGYFIIKARDMDHALELTNGFPDFDLGGTVEVREVMVM